MTREEVDTYLEKEVTVYTEDGWECTGYAGGVTCEFDTTSGEDELDIEKGEVEYCVPISEITRIEVHE